MKSLIPLMNAMKAQKLGRVIIATRMKLMKHITRVKLAKRMTRTTTTHHHSRLQPLRQ
jgi:hypothetical protein